MFIGKLNEKTQISLKVTKRDLKTEPVLLTAGNPFNYEPLRISWLKLFECGVDLHIALPQKYYINTAVIKLGGDSAPTRIAATTTDKAPIFAHTAETGKKISDKEIVLDINRELDSFIIEIDPEFSNMSIDSIELYGADFEGERIFPIPVSVDTGDGFVGLKDFNTISAESEAACAAAKILAEKYSEYVGATPTFSKQGKIELAQNADIKENGYRLCVNQEKIIIEGSDLRGIVYGCETLIKLLNDGVVPLCEINDWPKSAFRGVHLFMPAPDQFDFAKRLIKYILSPMGYNNIILQFSAGMRFDSHPEINEAYTNAVCKAASGEWPPFPHDGIAGGKCVEKAQVADFVRYARSFGIDVIPEIQSLGHVQFMTIAHPEIAEDSGKIENYDSTDERFADVPADDFYSHCYCPSNPKSYEILFDLIDEIVDVVKPAKYVHMGHDEVYKIGVCPVCSKRDPAELFAEDINKIHAHLAQKGLKMMIWSDMIQPVTQYKTPAAIDMIPKDILMLDFIWYFHLDKDIEDNLLAKDFEVVYGNLYSSHFPRYESRIRKQGIVGGQISAWVATDEEQLAREGKLYDFIFTAGMLWSEGYTHHARFSYDRLISSILPETRAKLQDKCYPSLCDDTEETVIINRGEFNPKTAQCGGKFQVNRTASSLIFEHTSLLLLHRVPWLALQVIGNYIVTYADNTTATIPVTYGGNIGFWNRRQNAPITDPFYRHNGYISTWESDGVEGTLENGDIATLYRYEWINPSPEKAIVSVEYVECSDCDTFVAINSITAVE